MNFHRLSICLIMIFTLLCLTQSSTAQTSDSRESKQELPRYNEHITVTGKTVTTGVIPDSSADFTPSQSIQANNFTDLADLLSTEFVEMNIIRKSGYGNEISLRGFSQSELRTTVNGGLLEGGCGSRKDPALSLISMMNIQEISVQQGPFDVTVPGALGGTVNVRSKSPEIGFHGDLLTRYTSTEAPSGGLSLHGGSNRIRVLAGYHYATADQYEDGNGNNLSSYRENTGRPYTTDSRDREAFTKEDMWVILEISPAENHVIRLEHSYGFGDDILTPRAGMDIDEETTHLTNFSYEISDLSSISQRLTISAYRNDVEHQPSDTFRELVGNPGFHRHNEVESIITGVKIENVIPVGSGVITIGADGFQRNWDGDMIRDDTGQKMTDLIPDVNILDLAGYVQFDTAIDNLEFGGGLRFDKMKTEADAPLTQSSLVTDTNRVDDDYFSGFVFARHHLTDAISWFTGAGHSVRFPTGVERYLQSPSPYFHGNPDLKATKNSELDIGIQMHTRRLKVTVKAMYSDLTDAIYQKGKLTEESHQTWTNIDAHMYGGDISCSLNLSDTWQIRGGGAWYRGRKDTQPDEYNTDRDLANMAPLKTHLGLYFHRTVKLGSQTVSMTGSSQWVHSEKSTQYDADAGEKPLDGWDTANLRLGFAIQDFELNLGIDNITDEEYAVANSYEWDVVAGDGANPTIVNEPGRTFFISLGYAF